MTYSNTLHQPSLLELARGGNCRALTYWMNSFLGPQGVQVQVQPAADQFLKVFVHFRRPRRRDACLHLRDRLARFICYRLWTLNSDSIQGVRIVARIAGDPKVLWQISVRINSPAAAKLRRRTASLRRVHPNSQARFRVFRALFMSSITLAGFFAGCWLFYMEMGRVLAKGAPSQTFAPADSPGTAVMPNGQGLIRIPLPPSQTDVSIPKQSQSQVISQVKLPDDQKVIALTFDDGPDSEVTAQVLDILEQYRVRATFFMSGANVEQQPDLAKRIVAEGHAVGNRGWSRFGDPDPENDLEQEVDQTAEVIEETTGAKTELFRPANGQINNKLVNYAKRKDYAVVLWSIDAQDSLVAAPIALDNVLRNVQPGRIVLLHDGVNNSTLSNGPQSATVQALPQMITALQNQGYRFVTVPKLLQMEHPSDQEQAPNQDLDKDLDKDSGKDAPESSPENDSSDPKPTAEPGTEPEAEQPDQTHRGGEKLPMRKPNVALAESLNLAEPPVESSNATGSDSALDALLPDVTSPDTALPKTTLPDAPPPNVPQLEAVSEGTAP